jgi:hypothetical protein
MSTQIKAYLEQATAFRREARRERFLAGAETPAGAALLAAAVALERAAGELTRRENEKRFGQGLRTYQRGA